MNVATTRIRRANTTNTPYTLKPSTLSVMAWAIVCNKPELATALPRERPPAAKMMMVHRKLLKSSLVNIPVPKNRAIGMMAMTPMSPNTFSNSWLAHQRTIVARVVKMMKY